MEGEEDILQKHHQHRLIIDEGPPPETRSSTFDDADDKQPPPPAKTKRVASLDIFRGLTVAMMVLVDGAGGEWPAIGHAPWEGCNLADFVMPFFLFIVGMAVPLSLKRIPNRLLAAKRVVLTFKDREAHFLGSSFARVDMQQIRRCGILQRIALAYLIVALLEISTKNTQSESQSHTTSSIFKSYLWQWSAGACILIVYLAMLYDMYVPNWEFTVHNSNSKDYGKVLTVACGVRGQLDPPCNAVGHIDRTVLGINHMYHHPAWRRTKACTDVSPHEGPIRVDAPSWCQAPFEPEGILSSISSIMTTIIGVHFGHVLVHIKDHTQRLRHWVLMGFALLISEIILHFTSAIPLNKQLYSFSWCSGACILQLLHSC
ncbi:hypothetical protein QJS10_CPA05g00422 [Acorus calamus]|uniref:Heparan-alpha-glucosaminide N-acetyltransferase catalytic domain-containing protein n=1 Tax=Acorus calamus TaxID=4465 RepID=A0AAV9EUH4_ACOCL|nr:hypothetical protein QJS10_CPA05g00422 [Acorus calamus]